MIRKCNSCGGIIENDKDICERCFKIKNYNEYSFVSKSNSDYLKIIESINNSNDLIIYVSSLFNLSGISKLNKLFNRKVLVVLAKKDLLPKSVKDYKIISYIKNITNNYIDIVIISSVKNYSLDKLYDYINKYKNSNNVYVVGDTNSGKSTLINKLIKNYSEYNGNITSSIYPNTTVDLINVNINDDLNIIDSPGLINESNISNYIDMNNLKNVIPKGEIRPKTRKVSKKTSFIVGNYMRIDYLSEYENSLTFYMNNNIKLENVSLNNNKMKDKIKREFILDNDNDIVIDDFGFIKFTRKCNLEIYLFEDFNIYKRDNLI